MKIFLIIYLASVILSVICYYIFARNATKDPEDEIIEIPTEKEKIEYIESEKMAEI